MKKILITASTFPRWDGDTEPRFILDYAKSMQKYYDVSVLVPSCPNAKDNEIIEGVNVIRYHYFPIRKWETLCCPGAIVARIKQKKVRVLLVPFLLFSLWHKLHKIHKDYDIIHAHWMIPQGIVQSYTGKTPYILTGHGSDITSLNVFPIKGMKIRAMKKASHITVVSEKLKEYVMDFYPNNYTDVMPMGCDTSCFSPKNRVENYFNQGNRKAILFVGRLAEVKGVKYLIQATQNIDNARLYIVGKGEMEDSLRELAKPMGDKVVFLGAKTHEELSKIVPSADVLVTPSITASDGSKEGFGLVLIEAMASGVPVVASNSGGIPNTITSGVNGLLTEEKDYVGIANAIRRILDDEELRHNLIENGKETAKKYDYSQIALHYRNIIENLLDGDEK